MGDILCTYENGSDIGFKKKSKKSKKNEFDVNFFNLE